MITKLSTTEQASAPMEMDEPTHQPRREECEDYKALTQPEKIGVSPQLMLLKNHSACADDEPVLHERSRTRSHHPNPTLAKRSAHHNGAPASR